jgi:hypothetical protein
MTDHDDMVELTAEDLTVMKWLADALKAEHNGTAETRAIEVGPFTAFNVIAAIQLAWRHPQMSESQKDAFRDLGDQIAELFGGDLREMVESGWDTEKDVPRKPARVLRGVTITRYERATDQGTERTTVSVEHGETISRVYETYYVNGIVNGKGVVAVGTPLQIEEFYDGNHMNLLGEGYELIPWAPE